MIKLLHDSVRESGGKFQVILTEHADLEEDWYREAVIERWRGGEALIPQSWIALLPPGAGTR